MSNHDHGVLLRGLDGVNPLAFLAALGTLRTLTLALSNTTVRMRWEQSDGAWRPRLLGPKDESEILSRLGDTLARTRSSHPLAFLADDAATQAIYDSCRRGDPVCDRWLASLCCEFLPRATSPLQLVRRDYFAGNLDQIIANTSVEHLRKALFEPWRYDDALDGQSLHFLPSEDRRHAYQWDRPSGDPNRRRHGNILGANRMAIEAIPLFTALPSPANPERLRAIGWTGLRSDDSRWTWPIWTPLLDVSVVASLLALPELQKPSPLVLHLRAMGVVAVYRCRRILVEKTPNLGPAECIA